MYKGRASIIGDAVITFDRSSVTWKSYFNLPFKVTLADREVGIDGVSVNLPKNEFEATNAFIGKNDAAKTVRAVVYGK